MKVATPSLRVADSRTDAWNFGWILLTLRQTQGSLLQPYLLNTTGDFDPLKYHRMASFHAYSAKIWGLTLFLAIFALIVYHTASPWVGLAIAAGIINFVDGMAIKLLLPTWKHDILSYFHAYRLRCSQIS